MTIIKVETFIDEYSKAVNEGFAAVFAGAGLSKPSGYVDWKNLLKPFADALGLDIDTELDLTMLAQFYRNEMQSRSKLNQQIIDNFSPEKELNKNIKIITRIPIDTYWTTNYDHLMERGLDYNKRTADIKITQEQLTNQKKYRDAIVYKMHGDVDYPNDAVLTKQDYEIYNVKRQLFITILQSQLVAKSFLFIGMSFEDPNIENVLSNIKIMLDENIGMSYWIEKKVGNPNLSKCKTAEEKDSKNKMYEMAKVKQKLKINELQRYGVSTVLIDDYNEITTILEEIEKRYLRNNIFVAGSCEVYDSPWDEEKLNYFCDELAKNLVIQNFKIYSGFGSKVGSNIINGALTEIYKKKNDSIEERLSLHPFPQYSTNKRKKDQLWKKYRESIISQVGVSIFIFGNKLDSEKNKVLSEGMWKEFEIAKKMGNLIIPIGATGDMAKKIYDNVRKDITKYPYLNEYIEDLGSCVDVKNLVKIILEILKNK